MKKTAIVTGGSKKDAPAIAVLIMNIKDTNPAIADEFVVFHDGICQTDQLLIQSIFPTRFIYYNFPADSSGFSDTVTHYFTTMVFCKYECFRLLSEYRTVIWTDYDVVIRGDLSELVEDCLSGIKIMPAPSATIAASFLPSLREADIAAYDIELQAIALPLFVLHDSIADYMKYYYWCIEKTVEYGAHLYLPEQGIVSLLIQEFDIKYEPLLGPYGTHPVLGSKQEIQEAKILHAFGQPKFWNGIPDKDWRRRYKKWQKMGGSKYVSMNGVAKKNRAFCAFIYRHMRRKR